MPISINDYPNGFARGLIVRNLPVQMSQPGKVWWLNNSSVQGYGALVGSNTQNGSYAQPFSTLAGALAYIANSGNGRGDILAVAPGHAETISSATALTLSVSGLMIVGYGVGANRPTFTLDTANTATINVAANGITIVNCIFVANFLNVAACFTLTTAKDFGLAHCSFTDTSAILNFAKIVNTSSTDNAADGLLLENNRIISKHATAAFSVFAAVGNMDRPIVRNNYIKSVTTNAAAALCPISAGKVLTNVDINNNSFNTVGASGTATGILITTNQTTNSGIINNNYIQNLDATTPILVTASSGFIFMENYYQSAADKSGALLPVNA